MNIREVELVSAGGKLPTDFHGHGSIEDAIASYHAEGCLILKNWFDQSTIEFLKRQGTDLWNEPRNERLIVDIGAGKLAGARMLLKDAPGECAGSNHKINDLYLENDDFRGIFLGKKLSDLLSRLLDGPPSLCNSLHFIFGSGQRAHYDTWYMPPGVEDKMAVVAVPLEPYTKTNRPLFYYPKSHLIPKYRFSNGNLRSIEVEMPQCDAYLFSEIEKRGLERVVFLGNPGDLFIWHSQLLHGGDPVLDPSQTRRSVVAHYWRHGDLVHAPEYQGIVGKERASHHGYYLDRDHQAGRQSRGPA
jgi:phytanoyl-CoA hydroxylase